MAKVKQKVIGRNKLTFTNRLPEFLSDKERIAAKVVTQGTMLIMTEASYRTPIDTNLLINSYQREIKKIGTTFIGAVFNTANYAQYVHDPAVVQNFTRASAVKEFLKVGGDAAAPMITTLLRKALKV